MVANRHWQALSERERKRLVALLRKSGGRPAGLTARERDEIRGLVGRLDLVGIGRELVPFASRARRR